MHCSANGIPPPRPRDAFCGSRFVRMPLPPWLPNATLSYAGTTMSVGETQCFWVPDTACLGNAAPAPNRDPFQGGFVGNVNLAELEEVGRSSRHLEISVTENHSSCSLSRKQQCVLQKEKMSFRNTSRVLSWKARERPSTRTPGCSCSKAVVSSFVGPVSAAHMAAGLANP